MQLLSALTSLMTCSNAVSLFPILELCVADDSSSSCGNVRFHNESTRAVSVITSFLSIT